MYNPIETSPAPSQRKFNGDYGFPYVTEAGEEDAGSVIIRGKLIGVSHRNSEVGDQCTAELQGTVTVMKAPATEFEVGDLVYWDAVNKLAVTTGTIKLGICKITPSADSETVEVLTNAVANA